MRTITLILILFCIHSSVLKSQKSNIFLPIEEKDKHPNYEEIGIWIQDTITTEGWKIEYLVKDDKTKYEDIYIRISKEDKMVLIKEENVLNFRKYFVPRFEGENSKKLYFIFASDTYTNGILIVDKMNPEKIEKYQTLVKYNIEKGEIYYLPELKDTDKFSINCINCFSEKEKILKYEGVCINPSKLACIKNIFEEGNYVEITCLLRENDTMIEKEETIRMER